MSKIKLFGKIGLGLLIITLSYKAVVYLLNKDFRTPTEGEKIVAYKEPRNALIVIDIQEDLTGITAKDPYPYKNSNEYINNVNNIIDIAEKNNLLIIYVRQEFESETVARLICGGRLIKGQPGTQLDSRLKIESQNVFSKKKSDAFSNGALEKLLEQNQVNQLYVIGLDADACVYNTSKGARNRNYKVSVIRDGIITMNMKKIDDILTKYTKDNISIINSNDFIKIN